MLTSALTDPFAEADEDTGEQSKAPDYIHIRIQRACIPDRLPARVGAKTWLTALTCNHGATHLQIAFAFAVPLSNLPNTR
jgi:hypothetical protein